MKKGWRKFFNVRRATTTSTSSSTRDDSNYKKEEEEIKRKLKRSQTIAVESLDERTADDVAAAAPNHRSKSIDVTNTAAEKPILEEDADGDDVNDVEAPEKPGTNGEENETTTQSSADKENKDVSNGGARPKEPRPGSMKDKKKKKTKEGKAGRHKKKGGSSSIKAGNFSPDKPLQFPCTPEHILEYHKRNHNLNPNEEWLIVEMNEYECLVEDMNIIQIIAKHSKFFEVDPDELLEEFFEFVEEVPSYDEIINWDVWQEFRDKKYEC